MSNTEVEPIDAHAPIVHEDAEIGVSFLQEHEGDSSEIILNIPDVDRIKEDDPGLASDNDDVLKDALKGRIDPL